MAYKKHLVLSNGTDQINLMSAGAIDARFSRKTTGYAYTITLNTVGSGYTAGDILTVSADGVTFNLDWDGSTIAAFGPTKGPAPVAGTNIDVAGGTGAGMTVDINATAGATLDLSDVTNYISIS